MDCCYRTTPPQRTANAQVALDKRFDQLESGASILSQMITAGCPMRWVGFASFGKPCLPDFWDLLSFC
jgi:hypothetical protein